MEKKTKLQEYIENIEELGASARDLNNRIDYYNDFNRYSDLLIVVDSIDYWSKKASRLIKKKIKENEVK